MTIYDIAKEAGVSASTVSRVMNGKPGIGEKTRKKIQNLLKNVLVIIQKIKLVVLWQ